jgi:hypothetical protein
MGRGSTSISERLYWRGKGPVEALFRGLRQGLLGDMYTPPAPDPNLGAARRRRHRGAMNLPEMRAAMERNRVEAEDWAIAFFKSLGPFINWTIHRDPTLHARKIADTLLVLWSGRTEKDGRRWVHVSCSRPSRLPSWEDVREVKDAFIGRDRRALQVLPPQDQYVNMHKHCLHLWCCVDDDGLPDFRVEGLV